VAGSGYRLAVDSSFGAARALESGWLRRALKAVALAWHLLAAAALYLLVRRTAGAAAAGAAGALYAANPALLLDVAHWAQPDGAHSLFGVLAIGWLGGGRPVRAWAALALAALAKPQAWALLPLAALATWHAAGARGLAKAAGAGAAAGAVVLLPFLVSGRLGDLLALPGSLGSAMPVVSANAHNLWWIVAAARGTGPLAIPDTAPLAGPLTYRAAAAALVGTHWLFVYWLYRSRRAGLAEAAALGTLGWFVLTTQAHENHAILAIPLLVLSVPQRPHLLPVLGALSATTVLNVALQDPLILQTSGLAPDAAAVGPAVAALRTLNAAAHVLCILAWSAAAGRRAAAPRPPHPNWGGIAPRPEGLRRTQRVRARQLNQNGGLRSISSQPPCARMAVDTWRNRAMGAEPLHTRLSDAEHQLADATARLRAVQAAVFAAASGDTTLLDKLVQEYRQAQRAVQDAQLAWLRCYRSQAPTSTPPAPPGASTPAPAAPRLRFARWLYQRGYLTG
jgi:hypothetical protein